MTFYHLLRLTSRLSFSSCLDCQGTSGVESLRELLTELEQFGQQNDAAIADRPRRMLNITRGTGEFLSVRIQFIGASAN
ncbi:hypothetical protein ACTXKF_16625 [Vreelandella alkaliphila]|uniref:hypothetical protein n=1 Tax=Halomonadaceae TaxID=28256 RepID=UPI001D0289FE|nr:hypothetical protein [Halomonas sp. FME65]